MPLPKIGNVNQKRTVESIRRNLFPETARPPEPQTGQLFTENQNHVTPAWRDPLNSIQGEDEVAGISLANNPVRKMGEQVDVQADPITETESISFASMRPKVNEIAGNDIPKLPPIVKSRHVYTQEELKELGLT